MKKPKKPFLMAVSILVLVLVIGVAMFYWYHQAEGRESSLVGDAVCGSPFSVRTQDSCCATAHGAELVIQCVGRWKYVNAMSKCQFVCDGALPSCDEDVKTCDYGHTVSRNASNECRFDRCG